jgi:hypothetical protein
MPDADCVTPAEPRDRAAAIAFALRFEGRKRIHRADEYVAAMTAGRVVSHLSAQASCRRCRARARGFEPCHWVTARAYVTVGGAVGRRR